jgi:hypothetical protein
MVASITLVQSPLNYYYYYAVSPNRRSIRNRVVRNSTASIDANKLERTQQRFTALCFNRFFPHVHQSSVYAL